MVSKKSKIIFFYLIGRIRHGIAKKGGYFQLGMGPKFGPERCAENPLKIILSQPMIQVRQLLMQECITVYTCYLPKSQLRYI